MKIASILGLAAAVNCAPANAGRSLSTAADRLARPFAISQTPVSQTSMSQIGPISVRIKLNPESVQTTDLWPDAEVNRGVLEFEVAEIRQIPVAGTDGPHVNRNDSGLAERLLRDHPVPAPLIASSAPHTQTQPHTLTQSHSPTHAGRHEVIAFRDGTRMLVGDRGAVVIDSNGYKIGDILFAPPAVIPAVKINGEESSPRPSPLVGEAPLEGGAPLRRLGRKKGAGIPLPTEPPVSIEVPPAIQGVYKAYPSEMYCRYGCGNIMGVTFPYFYRPFFGYGYPLLGTEANFPAGYGGNPITSLGVSGALGPVGPAGSVGIPAAAGLPLPI